MMFFLVGGLFVKQKVEKLEALTGFETENKYKIYLTGPDCVRGANQKAYFTAKEKSDCLSRQCCGNMRAFEMKIEAQTIKLFCTWTDLLSALVAVVISQKCIFRMQLGTRSVLLKIYLIVVETSLIFWITTMNQC